jgi:hypothetical protein
LVLRTKKPGFAGFRFAPFPVLRTGNARNQRLRRPYNPLRGSLTNGPRRITVCSIYRISYRKKESAMKVYKRTRFSLIQGLILTPFAGLAIFIIGQILLPVWIRAIFGENSFRIRLS